jgi:hypothetical protein
MLAVGLVVPVMADEPGSSDTPPEGYVAQTSQGVDIGAAILVADVLLIQDVNPWNAPSNEAALADLSMSYDLINSDQLASWDLTGYRCILYASDQPSGYYDNLAASILKIQNFVSSGGLLIAHCCDQGWTGGDWNGDHILPNNVQKGGNVFHQDLIIVDAAHPVIDGTPSGTVTLPGGYLDGWNYSTHGYLAGVDPYRVVIIESDPNIDEVTYAAYSYGLGEVLATMQTVEWGYSVKGKPELLRNELRYALARDPSPPQVKVPGISGWGILAAVLVVAGVMVVMVRRRQLAKTG